jgi:hypothetical protein
MIPDMIDLIFFFPFLLLFLLHPFSSLIYFAPLCGFFRELCICLLESV